MEKEKIINHLNFWPVFIIGILFIIFYLIGGLIWGFGGGIDGAFLLTFLFFGLFCIFLSVPGLFKIMGWKYGWIITIIGILSLLTIWIKFVEH